MTPVAEKKEKKAPLVVSDISLITDARHDTAGK